MYMVCYLGSNNAITFEREFGLMSEARQYIKDVEENVDGHQRRFIIKRAWMSRGGLG
jgi:hypothetical protein